MSRSKRSELNGIIIKICDYLFSFGKKYIDLDVFIDNNWGKIFFKMTINQSINSKNPYEWKKNLEFFKIKLSIVFIHIVYIMKIMKIIDNFFLFSFALKIHKKMISRFITFIIFEKKHFLFLSVKRKKIVMCVFIRCNIIRK